jgi:hypothetical protein
MRIKEILNENIGAISRIDITNNAILSGIAATLLRKLAPKANLYKFYVALYPGSWQNNSQYNISLETGSHHSPIPGMQQPVGSIDNEGNVNINKDIKTYVGNEIINFDPIQREIITRAAQKLLAPSIPEPAKKVKKLPRGKPFAGKGDPRNGPGRPFVTDDPRSRNKKSVLKVPPEDTTQNP